MKKIFVVLVCVLVLVSGCGSQGGENMSQYTPTEKIDFPLPEEVIDRELDMMIYTNLEDYVLYKAHVMDVTEDEVAAYIDALDDIFQKISVDMDGYWSATTSNGDYCATVSYYDGSDGAGDPYILVDVSRTEG